MKHQQWLALVSILALIVLSSFLPARTDRIKAGDLFPNPESAEWDEEDPFGAKPSLRYSLFALFTICHQPEKEDANLVHSLHSKYESKGVDVIAVTVLRGSKARMIVSTSKLKTPWVSIDNRETSAMGFPTSETAKGLLVDPCGRVVWTGNLAKAASAIDRAKLSMATLPRRKSWPRAASAVEKEWKSGDLTDALAEAKELGGPLGEAYSRAIDQWLEGRFEVMEKILATRDRKAAGKLLDQLRKQVHGSEWEQRARDLRKKLAKK